MGRQKIIETEEQRIERLRGYNRKYYAKPEKKTQQLKSNKRTQAERWKRYYQNNKAKLLEKYNREKAAKLQRIPPWADLTAIKEFYFNRPEGYHVDHIIPLRGKTVSGLHTLENLQYLPAKENMSKGNRYSE